MIDPRLEQAKAAIRSGDRATGGRLLMAILNEDPQNELAWLWMSGVVSDPQRKKQCLETVLEINPDNTKAKAGLLRLQALEMVVEEREKHSEPDSPAPVTTSVASAPEGSVPAEVIRQGGRANNRWMFIVGGFLLFCFCCAGPFAVLSAGNSALNAVASDNGNAGEPRVIPPTYTPSSGNGVSVSSGSSRGPAEYGEIAISRSQLAEYSERSALGMTFNRDLEYNDGTYHHTMCTPNCAQKLVMRSETYDQDDLDNLDYSFIYATEDELTVRSVAMLAIVGLAIPDWGMDLDQWYRDSAETFRSGGRETFSATHNGINVQLDFFYDAVDLEDAVLVTVEE